MIGKGRGTKFEMVTGTKDSILYFGAKKFLSPEKKEPIRRRRGGRGRREDKSEGSSIR